jgi:hypothetical protein
VSECERGADSRGGREEGGGRREEGGGRREEGHTMIKRGKTSCSMTASVSLASGKKISCDTDSDVGIVSKSCRNVLGTVI